MITPPFLELQYYVGTSSGEHALDVLFPGILTHPVAGKLIVPRAVGLSTEPEEAEVLRGVVILRTEGHAFCGPERERRTRLKRLGRRVYERFVQVADQLQSLYGAILVEYSLEEPIELRNDPRSLAFRDFFVNQHRLGQRAVNDILRVVGSDAYVEERHAGLYVSTSAEFNPQHRCIPTEDAQNRSVQISRIIGMAAA